MQYSAYTFHYYHRPYSIHGDGARVSRIEMKATRTPIKNSIVGSVADSGRRWAEEVGGLLPPFGAPVVSSLLSKRVATLEIRNVSLSFS